jgi:carboxyl-terminal processing protease
MVKSRLLIACVLITGIAAVSISFRSRSEESPGADLGLIAGVIQLVRHDYVHPVTADELTDDTLKGLLNRLDPHSDYMNEEEYRQSQADTAGQFGGLGMQITEQDGVPKVISPIDGTPAAHAGIEPGDEIILVNHESTRGMALRKVVGILRGDPGSTVTLTILRGKQPPFDMTLTRQIIRVESVKSKLEPNNIGYIRISQFGDDTSDGFKKAIADFKRNTHEHVKGLVIDLRDDPGGLLNAAVDVAGDLLDAGTVVSIRGRRASENRAFNAPRAGDMLPGVPVVVLINGASASASEIVAGALHDRHRAVVMGTQSFGKGSVQTIIALNGKGAVRLTTALYFTPSGRSIQDEGITPDIVVEAPKDQQISGGVMVRESALHGAFANPGPLQPGKAPNGAQPPSSKNESAYSAPIKADLIGKPDDAQLNAALSYLERSSETASQPQQ